MTLLETLDGLKEELRVDLTFRTWQRVANEVDRLYDTPGLRRWVRPRPSMSWVSSSAWPRGPSAPTTSTRQR